MMKIAIIICLFPPKWIGGTEIATYNIAKHLAKRGHEVHVITSFDKGGTKESMEKGFYIHRIAWKKVRFLGVLSFWLKILLFLKKINPGVVYVQSVGIGIPTYLAKVFLKKTYVVWGQGSDVYFPWRFKKPISKLVLRNADAVIALTEDMKREMQKSCDRDIYVIPNGINLEGFEDLSREDINSKDEKTILFVGTLRPVKGVRYLIEAMKIIRQANPNIRLMVVGDGEDRDKLEKLVRELNLCDCINFVGQVPNENIPEYMAASDVFVLPSLSEGFPVVTLEAMASGLPIIATTVRGMSEIIKNAENGFLVEPQNPEQIAEKVLLILRDNGSRERISRNNKEKSKEYGWGTIVKRLEEVYQGLFVDF